MITTVLPNSAARAAGLTAGDKVLSVNAQAASQLAPSDVLVILSGPVGSDVEMLVMPKDSQVAQPKHLQLSELLP